ncbi:HNH endonuclease signature motif containing protein [Azohydromonas australica]|uniref:HNH endonuclease signature motif containing protein n=1 Tax=Azohydromonas australica TaxID=364039 RepID=UPI0003FA08F6|nr:HNH endonuclease signature motif containing protein [Azohydromonas australica]
MSSFAFYFHADVFEHKRQLLRGGTSVVIDHVGATPRLPFKDIAAGDELFIVGLSGNHLHLAGRLVAADRPMSRSEALARTGRHDLVDKALICLATPASVDVFRPDLRVPVEVAQALELFNSDGEPVRTEGMRQGRFELNVLRSCPRLSAASAAQLRQLLGQGSAAETRVAAAQASAEAMSSIEARRGSAALRTRLLQAWGGRCAVTDCAVEALLEVAHMTPAAPAAAERLGDAMVLRSDIHTLFDLGLMAFDDRWCVRVSPQLRDSEYWAYNGRAIQPPEPAACAACVP